MTVIDEIIETVKQLPKLSESAGELIRMAGKDEVSAEAMGAVIEKDPALAGQLIRVANSAAFHPVSPITSIQFAVSFLGNRTTMGIIMGFCVSARFKKPLDGYMAPEGALWNYCMLTAITARHLTAFSLNKVAPDLAYTAGLLHAIGKSVISEYLANKVLDTGIAENAGKDFTDVENEALGTNHCEIGEAIARHWNLPEEICQVIKYYHKPNCVDNEYKTLVYVVHLASFLAMMTGKCTGLDSMQYKLDESYDKYLSINTAHDLERTIVDVQKEFNLIMSVSMV